jgi:hypothetical protein
MDAEWLTYREAAKRLGSNIEAVRQRAIRCRWPRTLGNDKRARIQIPEGLTDPSQEGNDRGTPHPLREGNDRAYHRPLEGPFIKALEAHVETLKEQLAAAEARAEKQATESAELLAAERERADKAIAAFASLADRLDALAAQRARPWWKRLAG